MKPIESLIFSKNDNETITKHLSLNEFKCNCNWDDCYYTVISYANLESFSRVREEFNKPIKINSGHRCQRKNRIVPDSSEKSNHIVGDAMDITIMGISIEKNSDKYFKELDRLESIAKKYYKFTIRYKTFIHCDNRFNKRN